MKKLFALLLALAMLLGLTGCSDLALMGLDIATDVLLEDSYDSAEDYIPEETYGSNTEAAQPENEEEPQLLPEEDGAEMTIDESGMYYSAEDVALYIHTYGRLPDNFITKDEARALGWEGGSVERYAPGFAIGGDTFGNREGLLPKASGRVYYECDIDTNGSNSRGAKRIVFSNDGLIYYTDDHYESFTLIYGEE